MSSLVEKIPGHTEKDILYICLCIGFGGFIRSILKCTAFGDVRIPYSSFVLLTGILIGLIALGSNLLDDLTNFIFKMNIFNLTSGIFPPLIFKTAFQMDIHIFLKSFPQIIIISTLGFAFACFLNGIFLNYIAMNIWSIKLVTLFGIMASLTDIKETSKILGQFKNLGVLLAGEEIIIASLAMFFYEIIVHFSQGSLKADPVSVALYEIAVPILIGLIIGKIYVCFINMDRCDYFTNITASCFVSYTLLYSAEIFLGVSGVLTLIVFGIILCCNKRQMVAEFEHSLSQFWVLIYSLFIYVVYIDAGIVMVHACQMYGQGRDIIGIFLTYVTCLLSRSLMFMILLPILKRIGYGLDWKCGTLLVWGSLKGTSTLVFALCVYMDSESATIYSYKILIYAVGLVLMQMLINGSTLRKLIKLLGMSTISVIKISNMNSVMKHVMTARDRSINMLKMNRLFADADWDVVRNATKIVHPYKDFQAEEGSFSEGEEKASRSTKCPDCHKEIPHQPSNKELSEIKREAYLRILKAKKVSYWRQYEWGLMSKEANRTLVGSVDTALEKNHGLVDVNNLENLWKPRGYAARLRNKLVRFLPKNKTSSGLKAPLKTWQLHIYNVTTSLWWEYGIFFLVILNIISVVLDYVCRPVLETFEEMLLVSLSSILFILLFIQILCNILGIGCYNYMGSMWHFIDMVTFAITFFYLFYVYKFYISKSDKYKTHLILMALSTSRLLQGLRLIRINHVVRSTIPKIVEHLDKKIDVQLAHGYDVGKGFVTGELEVLKLLPRFVSDKHVLEEIKVKIEADRLAITKEIGILQRDRPTTAITVKTRESMAAVLHAMKESTKELKDGGLLDDEEFKLLSKAIEEQQKLMRKRYLTISPCQPDMLLRQVSWLLDNEETANFLIAHAFMVNLNFEEILLKTDEEPQGIYILVSGLVRMSFSPNLKKLEGLEKQGALPNVDYPVSVNYSEGQEDYIVSGNVIGEIGILTRRTYDATITCESSVQAYFISIDVMNYAMKSQAGGYYGLEQRIWKAVSVRIACIILSAVPSYQSWTQEMIQIHLERAFVPKLNPAKLFMSSDIMEAVLLIQGRAFDIINKDVYLAPSYIPRTVRKLRFLDADSDSEPRIQPILLIVPAKDVDEQELMDNIEGDVFSLVSVVNVQRDTLQGPYERKEKKTKSTVGLGTICQYHGGVRTIRARSFSDANDMPSSRYVFSESDELKSFQKKLSDECSTEDKKTIEEEFEEEDGTGKKVTGYNTSSVYISKSDYKLMREKTESEDVEYGEGQSTLGLKSEEEEDSKPYTLSYFNYKSLCTFEEENSGSEQSDAHNTEQPLIVNERERKKTKSESSTETTKNDEGRLKADNEEHSDSQSTVEDRIDPGKKISKTN